MAHKPGDLDNVPHFIRAASPKRLRDRMLKNNLKHGLIFDYYQIYRDPVDLKIYAWFQMNALVTMEEEVREAEEREN